MAHATDCLQIYAAHADTAYFLQHKTLMVHTMTIVLRKPVVKKNMHKTIKYE